MCKQNNIIIVTKKAVMKIKVWNIFDVKIKISWSNQTKKRKKPWLAQTKWL